MNKIFIVMLVVILTGCGRGDIDLICQSGQSKVFVGQHQIIYENAFTSYAAEIVEENDSIIVGRRGERITLTYRKKDGAVFQSVIGNSGRDYGAGNLRCRRR